MTFIEQLLTEYPVPMKASIWGSDGVEAPLENINNMIESCVKDISSDIAITEFAHASGMKTMLPPDTITATSAKLSQGFQGNRLVKVTFDASNKAAYLRYYPAIITYRRKLRVADLEVLSGDKLIFTKAYMLWKLSQKELQVLSMIKIDTDNGEIDLTKVRKVL